MVGLYIINTIPTLQHFSGGDIINYKTTATLQIIAGLISAQYELIVKKIADLDVTGNVSIRSFSSFRRKYISIRKNVFFSKLVSLFVYFPCSICRMWAQSYSKLKKSPEVPPLDSTITFLTQPTGNSPSLYLHFLGNGTKIWLKHGSCSFVVPQTFV